jgi:hypothetical protein
LIVFSVLVADMTPQSMLLPVAIGTKKQTIETQALLDCGASGKFMDSEFAKLHNIPLVTSVTPRWTPTDSERDFGNRLNHYPHFTSFSISNILPHSLTVAYSQPSVIAPIPA